MWKPVRNPEIQLQELGDETILYSPEQEAVHVLNQTALLIWQHCDGQNTINDIATIVQENFNVKEARDIHADIRRTLEVLVEKNLVENGNQLGIS